MDIGLHGKFRTSTGHCCSTLLEALHFRHPDSSGAGIRFPDCPDPVFVDVEVWQHRSYALVNFHCRCWFECFPSSTDVDVVVVAVAMLIWLCSCATTSDESHPWRTRKTTEQEVVVVVVRACEAVVVAVAQARAAVVAAVVRATSECDFR